MSKSSTRPVAVTVAALCLALVATSGPAAEAKPSTRPGRVTQLAVDSVTKPTTAYRVATSWKAATSTTSYRVTAVDASGAVLDKGTVTTPGWVALVKASAQASVRITVTPYDDARKGASSRTTTVLPDLTAPTGAFQLARTGQDVTLTQTALSDDVSQPGQITRSVDWGDGTPAQAWGSGTTTGHTFAGKGLWHPSVTLTDAAGNTAVVSAGVVVIGDETEPTGAFSTAPTSGWAAWTPVALTQLSIHDDFSADADIRRTVAWGDGTQSDWPTGAAVDHVYQGAGTWTPQVTLVDEAGNAAVVGAPPVTVVRDEVAPSVWLWLPRHHRTSIRRWRTLEGRARDHETGTSVVRVKAVQKRATGWYGYRPSGGRWVSAATARGAWRKARPMTILPASTGAWLCTVRRLAKGVLVYKVVAHDQVGNASAPVSHRQRLTRR